ncbi:MULTISPECIES: histidine phosphatase family protein [unclassified Imperialibacter]|uniref:histidine phosphatase family protein n=1 Tax=unclassified Imperialibacter TaxID=2629706 RepID=UPI00125943D6|nr:MULTISPECIES: histidine phosphatase family protein [unclassified Imperialibacter]CAD5281137.1 Histidine phosphatase family protein [Imperialibacter sp. 75]CAD5296440.1 Histidine phosphatase family protein [Imperialibacter sp. 89]VVT27700.1 Histidine phosphatase family protein [Imperialibacter sp. EC-SDR9]
MKQLYIVRHGETQFNREKKVQGRGVNAPLNQTGQEQARAFFNHYKDEKFNKVYVSSLIRTYQSVESFINQGIPHEKLEGLDEISWGNKEGLAFEPDIHSHYLTTLEAWQRGELDQRIDGGESPIEVMERQKQAMNYILSKSDEEKVLICMHGRAIRILVCWMLGYPLQLMESFGHSNLGLYVFNYTGGQLSMVTSNDVSHLVGVELI